MIIPTPASLRNTRRRVDRKLELAQLVLAEMRDGCALHLQHTPAGPSWVLSNGHRISDIVARLVITSSSVIDCGDALFAGVPSQTFRWWSATN
jgi:hypothetical protein